VIAGLQLRVATVDDAYIFNDPAVDNLAIRRLNKSEFIDASKAR